MKVTNKIIIRRRAAIRLKCIKDALHNNKIYTVKECKRWVHEDWTAAKLANITGKEEMDDESDDIRKIRFVF